MSPLGASDLRKALDEVEDFYVVAEAFGIEDEARVDEARRALRIEGDPSSFDIRYRSPGLRPIQLEVVTEEKDVHELCEEARERVDPAYPNGAKVVLEHLDGVVEVASFELGFPQLEDMGIVIAGQLGEYLARVGSGLIRDQNDDWWSVDDNGIPHVIVGPETRRRQT